MRNVASSFIYNWFNEVWNKGDENAIDKFMSADTKAHGIVENQPAGAEEFKAYFRGFLSQFHDIHVDVEDVISQDDFEAGRTTVSAVHTASGTPVRFSGMSMARLADGKIAEAWNNYDFLNMYQQLGMQMAPKV
ncbi:MAG: ester cyclase [Bacteroidota bacterium]